MQIQIYADGQNVPVYTDSLVSNVPQETNTITNTGTEFQATLDSQIELQNLAKNSSPEMLQLVNNLFANGATEQSAVVVPTELEPIFRRAAETYGIDEGLLIAVAKQESNFRTDATSSAGAMGIMQLMPTTAAAQGVTNAYDAEQSIMAGARLLAAKLESYDGNVSLALASYNAGSGSVRKYDGIPEYTETQNYIPKILMNYASGYTTADGSISSTPSADTVLRYITQYNSTNGSATGTGRNNISDSQKTSLSNLMLQGTALLLREQLLASE